ncbi:MAG: hypothetical protein KDH17_18060 [Rhodocyclaceae bacterium]|nr:hypothetical protein [Rhodocyclaceae bacterium]
MVSPAFAELTGWANLLAAWHAAARGKRGRATVAAFESRLADRLLELGDELRGQRYRPGAYRRFEIHEPKRRLISAAPFRDRVVHHALCRIIEPRFERLFIADSYANRIGKGNHRAVARLQQLARSHRYVLRADVVQHFASIDHQILRMLLARRIPEADIMALVDRLLASGDGVLDSVYEMVWFPGDDLLALCRPRGLPIGNLSSQFWSNCYLHPFDQFVQRELRCRAYLRYVDDFALFADDKKQLWAWKRAIVERLAGLRLTIHETATQVQPVAFGIPWLGFIVYPTHIRLKGRKVGVARRRLAQRFAAWRAGEISFAELDASVKAWVAHARHADSWGLRRALPSQFPLGRE